MAGPVLEQAVQDVPVVGRCDVERDVVEAAEEPLHGGRVEVVGRDVGLERVGDEGAVAVVVEVAPGDADDPVAGGQLALAVAVVQRREQLAQRQVAGAAEHREVTVLGQGTCTCWAPAGVVVCSMPPTVSGLLDRYKRSLVFFRTK